MTRPYMPQPNPPERLDLDAAVAVCHLTGWPGVADRLAKNFHRDWWTPDPESEEGKLLALLTEHRTGFNRMREPLAHLRALCNKEIAIINTQAYRTFPGSPIINPPVTLERVNALLRACDAVFSAQEGR